jgi:hypothetical protein
MMTPMDEERPERSWALPGTAAERSPAEEGPDEGPGAAAPRSARPPSSGTAGDVPVLGLRPMTVADILDGGFAVLRARPRRIIGLAACFVVPIQLVAAFLQRSADGGIGVGELWSSDPTVFRESSTSTTAAEVVGLIVALVGPALALVFVAAAIAHLVGGWSIGRDPSARELASVLGRRWWPLVASFVLVKLAEALGTIACYIGLVFVMPLFVSVAPVIGIEGVGPIAAMKRSARLTSYRYWPVLGISLLIGVVATLLGLALSALPQALAAWIGYDVAWPLFAVGSIAAELVVMPVVAASTVLLYLDLRVRSEGFDLELEALDLFAGAPA